MRGAFCRGLQAGDKVAVLMDNGLFTAQIFLGAMYGGFVSTPLNVRAGVSQLSYTLGHSDAKIVFVERQYDSLLSEVLTDLGRPVETISADRDVCPPWGAAASGVEGMPAVRAEDAALVMYTSGSTGQPKGAVHAHASLLAHGRNSIAAHQFTAKDRSILVLPLYHINAECVTLMPTLMSGGSIVVPHQFSVSQFWDWIGDCGCTWSAIVPTIVSQLLDWDDPKAGSRADVFRRVRFLRSSSAPLSPSLHQEFLDKFELPLIQAMGSSEAGNIFSNPVPPGANKLGSPGLPWGFELRIVDRAGVDFPTGEPGEILIRGDGMMQGYYKDSAETAAAIDDDGWWHTGDLAYRDEDGYVFVVGRSKELIIKGGVNIAPKQIDEAIELVSRRAGSRRRRRAGPLSWRGPGRLRRLAERRRVRRTRHPEVLREPIRSFQNANAGLLRRDPAEGPLRKGPAHRPIGGGEEAGDLGHRRPLQRAIRRRRSGRQRCDTCRTGDH